MPKITHFIYLFIIAAIIMSCNRPATKGSLGEKEFYIDSRLASISPDGDSACWIGSETGDIWHIGNGKTRAYNIGEDRIYKVVSDTSADGTMVYWIGERNSGLQKWVVIDGKAVCKGIYNIPYKKDKYSAYDIKIAGDYIYSATSQGLYVMKREGGEMKNIYPGADSNAIRKGNPFAVYNLCGMDNGNIMAASKDGLILFDSSTNKTTLLHKGMNITSVSCYDNKVYSISDKKMLIDSTDGKMLNEINLGFSSLVHCKVHDTHYFIGENYIVLSADLRRFTTVPLRHKVPQFCSNIINASRNDGYTSLITENALWRIPHHVGVFNLTGEIMASCTNGKDMFYINSENELFHQNQHDSTASKIYTFSGKEAISRIMTAGDKLYCICNQRKVIRVNLKNSYLRNELSATIETMYNAPTKITAAYAKNTSDGPKVYVGIQDELIAIDKDGIADTIKEMSGKYITAFYSSENTELVYMATLNKGIFYGRDNSFRKIEDTENSPFVRDIFVTNEHIPMLTMLTNHNLIVHETQDTIKVKGYKKLLYVNDSLFYALPEYGIHSYVIRDGKMVCTGKYYGDIQFNPNASFACDGKLYLGSNIGILRIDAYGQTEPSWVHLDTNVPNIHAIFGILVSLLLIFLTSAFMYKKRNDSKRRMIRIQIDDLHNRLKGILAMADINDQYNASEAKELSEELDRIDVNAKDAIKEITRLSKRILYKNRDMGMSISRQLDSQIHTISDYDIYDKTGILEESYIAAASENTKKMMSQIIKNQKWINGVNALLDKIEQYKDVTEGTIVIEGINTGFEEKRKSIADDIRCKSLAELEHDIKQLDNMYNYIFSDDALRKIESFIDKRTKLLVNTTKTDDVTEALSTSMHNLKSEMAQSDRIELLRKLCLADNRIELMLIKESIANKMEVYAAKRNGIINDSDNIHDIDTKLEIEIADSTQNVTESIENLIHTFYSCMLKTDGEIVHDILKFSNFSKQSPKVLALLIADPKVKRTLLPGMLGMFGNLNPVISRLMNSRIRNNYDILKTYTIEHPDSIVNYILHLTEI